MKKVFMWGEIILIAIMGAVLLAGCGDKKDDKKKENKVNNDTNVSCGDKVIALAGGLNYMLDVNETTDFNSAF